MCDWLKSLNMEQYVPEFRDKDVDGELLLQMDGTKLKVCKHIHVEMEEDRTYTCPNLEFSSSKVLAWGLETHTTP